MDLTGFCVAVMPYNYLYLIQQFNNIAFHVKIYAESQARRNLRPSSTSMQIQTI